MEKKTWHDDVFFGLHFDIHADENDTEIGKGLTKEHLVKELSKIRPDYIQCDCKGHRGYTSWPAKTGTPSPGIVADPLKIWTEAAREMGIPIVMHYSGVWDYAAILAHPEYGRVNAPKPLEGSWTPRETNSLGRDSNMTCPLSRYTQDVMIKQMIELIDGYGVNGFWVDGECWASEPCYCEACIAEYKKRRGREDIPVPASSKEEGWQDWLAYQRENFELHVKEYSDAVHAHAPDVTICSNWMYTLRHPDDITAPIDYISGDFAWVWSISNAETESRFISGRNTSWELMAWGFTNHGKGMSDWVFKTVPALCQEAAVVLSQGGSFLVYDTPERSCRIIPWHMDILSQTADFCRSRREWHGGDSVPQCAVLHAPGVFYEKNIPLYNLGEGADPVEGALAVLLDSGYDGDILNETDFFKRMDKYPLCVIPAARGVDSADIVERLKDYVEKGGILLLSGLDETNAFDGLLGVREVGGLMESKPNKPQLSFLMEDNTSVAAQGQWRQVERIGESGFTPLFWGRDPFLGMRPAEPVYPGAVWRKKGKGFVAGFFGPFLKTYAYARFPRVKQVFNKVMRGVGGDKALCRLEGPGFVHMSVMEKNNAKLVHLYNTGSSTPNTPKTPYIEDVPRVYNLRLSIPLEKPPEKVNLVPNGNPVSWSYKDGILEAAVESLYIYEILEIK